MRFFLKENPASPLILGGAVAPFTIAGDTGYLAVDPEKDKDLCDGLADAVKQRVGAVLEITEAQFNEKKNRPVVNKSRPNSPWQQPLKIVPQPGANNGKPARPAPGADAAVADLVKAAVDNKFKELQSGGPLGGPLGAIMKPKAHGETPPPPAGVQLIPPTPAPPTKRVDLTPKTDDVV